MIDMGKLKRNETFIRKNCKVINKALIASGDISLFVPVTFEGTTLLALDERIYSIASILYTDGKEYAISNLTCMMELGLTEYSKTSIIGFDGEETECFEFKYSKGDKIHPTNEVPIIPSLAYHVIKHHMLSGKTVPYMMDDDVDSILDSIPRLCRFGLPEYGYVNHFPEMVSRDANDLKVPYRLSKSKKFAVIPFSSVILNVSSVIGQNQGGYLEDGLMVSTTSTSKSSTTFEKVMRS